MKTLMKLLLVIAILGAIYFGTIGRDDLYRFISAAQDVIQSFASNYTKK